MRKKPDIVWVSGKLGNGKRFPTIVQLAVYDDGRTEVLQELTEATPADLGCPDDPEFSLSPPPITPEELAEEKAKMERNLSKFASERYSQGKLFPWQNGECPPETPPLRLMLDFSGTKLRMRKAPAGA